VSVDVAPGYAPLHRSLLHSLVEVRRDARDADRGLLDELAVEGVHGEGGEGVEVRGRGKARTRRRREEGEVVERRQAAAAVDEGREGGGWQLGERACAAAARRGQRAEQAGREAGASSRRQSARAACSLEGAAGRSFRSSAAVMLSADLTAGRLRQRQAARGAREARSRRGPRAAGRLFARTHSRPSTSIGLRAAARGLLLLAAHSSLCHISAGLSTSTPHSSHLFTSSAQR
jgi:hypothetical protein